MGGRVGIALAGLSVRCLLLPGSDALLPALLATLGREVLIKGLGRQHLLGILQKHAGGEDGSAVPEGRTQHSEARGAWGPGPLG